MPVVLSIPDEIIDTIKMPRKDAEKALLKEMAFLLYERGFASMGVARKLSGLSKWEFIEGLKEREIFRHYDERELDEDITYAHSGQ